MIVYAFVPAKSSSSRVANKNMQILQGERLFVKALKTLLKCKEIDKVFLDTDSEMMYELVDYLPIEFMKRDKSLATNQTDGHQLFLNEVRTFPQADIYVQLLCTSPFIKPETIDNAILQLKAGHFDSAILMKKEKVYLWQDNAPAYDKSHIPNSDDLPDTIQESMGLYISTKQSALRTQRRYGDNPLLLFGESQELIDINTPQDLEFAKIYAQGLKEQEHRQFTLLRHLLTSPMLSDCLDDLKTQYGQEYGAVINGWQKNMDNTKLLGRASTLRLRALRHDEDFRGIYKALESYKEVSTNDIIVVENELSEFAYFGDLNARMAIRAGACGAIINGATRDLEATKQLGFPVFAKSYNAADVRGKATLDSINKPITIENVTITPGDLIFIDECAMVVIYERHIQEVLSKVSASIDNEKNIANDILNNKKTQDILSHRGNF